MHYIWQHIETITNSYTGSTPLVHFLKNYYKQHPKLGSRDRRMLSEMAYCWYRCSKAFDTGLAFKEKVAACLLLCNTDNQRLLQLIEPLSTQADYSIEKIFPRDIQISTGITKEEWLESMLSQPRLFIRARKTIEKLVEILEEHEIDFEVMENGCIALPNGTSVDQWLPEYAYLVQDASSQKTGAYFDAKPYEKWWDCCSGAGGKSLLLKDKEPLVDLLVSDSRKTILNNLKERFRTYSHPMPTAYEINMEDAAHLKDIMQDRLFDAIICDAPCTGSGTWARTPEQMYFFKPGQVEEFSEKQKRIASNVVQYLKPGGKLYYITCSIFKDENEEVVKHLTDNKNFKMVTSQLINGTGILADSMYIAVLEKV